VIPVPKDQRRHRLRRGNRGGRPPAFDRETYKQRNTVERCINRLKQWRGIATRYEKTATIYLAGLHAAGIFLRSARWSEQKPPADGEEIKLMCLRYGVTISKCFAPTAPEATTTKTPLLPTTSSPAAPKAPSTEGSP
jgi:hypothetical protein